MNLTYTHFKFVDHLLEAVMLKQPRMEKGRMKRDRDKKKVKDLRRNVVGLIENEEKDSLLQTPARSAYATQTTVCRMDDLTEYAAATIPEDSDVHDAGVELRKQAVE